MRRDRVMAVAPATYAPVRIRRGEGYLGQGDNGVMLRRATVEDADALAVPATRTFVPWTV